MVEEKGDVRVNANFLSFVYESVTSPHSPLSCMPRAKLFLPPSQSLFLLRWGWAIGDPMGHFQGAYRMSHRINIPSTLKNIIDDGWFFYPIECKKD
jgi:hypothetical protein